jgi:6-pyruvoyltetrahydropterin/6-carboxytetrahydropterin synthase
MPRYEVRLESEFSAAHALRNYKGGTEPTHGHNFRVTVVVSAPRVDRAGMAIDFVELKKLLNSETGRLHGTCLNEDVSEFRSKRLSPSAENIAATLFKRLKKRLPKGVRLENVAIGEAPGCSAMYRE